jgi:branched-chain amino acid transport system ATP-binding protein
LAETAPRLEARSVVSGFTTRPVVEATLEVWPGETVALIGHNGAGKSTLLKALVGLLPVASGEVFFEGRRLADGAPNERRALGIVYVPQGNRIFTNLTVRDHLELACLDRGRPARREAVERAVALFPDLALVLGLVGGSLSGGQRQTVALAAAMASHPRLLLLDEPLLGLAPRAAMAALKTVGALNTVEDVSVIMVEHNVPAALTVARRVYVLRHGRVSFTGAAAALANTGKLRDAYF